MLEQQELIHVINVDERSMIGGKKCMIHTIAGSCHELEGKASNITTDMRVEKA